MPEFKIGTSTILDLQARVGALGRKINELTAELSSLAAIEKGLLRSAGSFENRPDQLGRTRQEIHDIEREIEKLKAMHSELANKTKRVFFDYKQERGISQAEIIR